MVTRRLAFLFSLEAAFSLTLAIIAAAYLFAFAPQQEEAGTFLACSDAARVLAQSHAFSSQGRLNATVSEAGSLLGACVEAEVEGAGLKAISCGESTAGEKLSFSFPVWSGGKVQAARVSCWQVH